ncbi:MAG: Uma2 family endonuclease [Verrucomicrobia bacterium]|nr:Uma2 family endonuclease [Verrucomicrobiota bacterium]
MHALAGPLLESPELPEIVDMLNARLCAERTRRKRFLDELTPSMKAEFINGDVVLHSPAKSRHIAASDNAFSLIRAFILPRGLGRVMHEKALVSFPRNDYEPDVAYFSLAKAALIEPDQLRMPVPDLIVEVLSDSTAANDRGIKFADYAAHGVGEYWIVDPEAETIEVYLRDTAASVYLAAAPLRGAAIVRSRVLAGLEFPAGAIFDEAAHLDALNTLPAR